MSVTLRPNFRRRALLSCSALIPALLSAGAAHAQAAPQGGAGNLIVPDGRTGTSVSSVGSQTDITTTTVRGNTGFNSFSQFQTGTGSTVNLHLPTQTDTLVNIVRDGPAVVEGTLNALKNGTIGGNVVFSDPYGFVLGKEGVINAGGLTVNTPTKEYLDRAIDAAGRIDTDATDRLISGEGLPISPDGSVVIRGRVNAESLVNIHAADIAVEGGAKLRTHRRNFDATVNTKGAQQGGALVVRNGKIQLLATGDVKIGGTVSARAKSRESARNGAGTVSIRAAKTITVTPTARIEALAEIARDGGTDAVTARVDLAAGGALDVEGVIAADGSNGAGAAVNLSAERAAIKAGALLSAQSAGGLGQAAVSVASGDSMAFDGAAEALGGAGSRIDVRSDVDIALGAASSLDATGTGDATKGGDIYVVATRDLDVADGATAVARGTGNADGGFLELSGHNTVRIGAAKLDLRSAGTGTAGTLLIDPNDLTIANATTYVRGASGNIVDNLGKVEIQADTITIAAGGRIDTRKAGADSFNVTLKAKTITVAVGGSIRADVSSADATAGYKSGTVSLEASDTRIYAALRATAAASIVVAGEVRGGTVSMTATSKAVSSATDALFDNPVAGVGVLVADSTLSYLTGLSGGYVAADSTAKIDIRSTAVIAATGDLNIIASGQQIVSNLGINITKAAPVQMTAFYGELDSVTSAEIQSGASVSVGGNLQLIAKNDALLGVNAMSVGLQDTPVSGAIAIGLSHIDTKAIIHSGAVITPAGNVTVLADNTNSFAVTATAMALGNAKGGLGLAVQISTAQATARIGADLGTMAAKSGHVSVAAISDTLLNKTQGSASVGDTLVQGIVVRPLFASAGAGVASTAQSAIGGSDIGSLATESVKAGFGIAIGLGTQGADASIAADVTPTTSGGAAPKIVSRGNVSVVASVYDSPIRNDASASIESAEQGSTDSTTASDAAAVSVAVGSIDHVSHATIGQNVGIDAENVGVSATSAVPITIAYNNAKTPLDMLKAVVGAINGNGGVVNNVITSYSATTVASRDIGIAGAVNYLAITHDTLAWVGSNATIVTHQAGSSGWDAALGGAADRGTANTRHFQAGLDVAAASSTETINIAGNPAWFVVVGGNAAQGGEGSSGGGSLNLNLFSARTVAGIGDGASVTAAADVHVDARMSDSIFAVAPSSGSGAAFGVSGLMTYLGIENQTYATISNTARIATQKLDVSAHQETLIVSVSGALSQSTGTSVGLAATWSTLSTDTAAYFGDNDALVAGTKDANLSGFASGEIRANTVGVQASTGGAVYSMSVAAAIAAPETGEEGLKGKITNSLGASASTKSAKISKALSATAGGAGAIKTFFGTNAVKLLDKVSSKLTKDPATGQTRDFSMAGAGSLSGVLTHFDTAAYIDGATIKRLGANGSVAIAVDASNDLLISTTSGAGSLALAGQDSAKSSAAVAGAFAVAFTDNQTTARIRNSVATDTGSVRVRAIASGQQVVLGLGIAANTNANSSVSIAGSVSFGGSTDGVNALVDGSTLTASNAAPTSDIQVLAYQNTDIGIGGLAVSVATKGGGFGLALTATVVTDPAGGKTASARVINSALHAFRNLDVEAITVSRIMSGAGAVAVTPNGLGIQGAVVFNDISPTTLAEVNGNGTQKIELTGDATVRAGSERRADIEAELATVIKNKTIDAGFNFSSSVFGTHTTGAVIFGVAGTVGFGQSNAGFALEYGGIRHSHEAYLGGVELTTVGNVTVEAKDNSKIFGSAAGVSIGTGGFAGSGSVVVNLIQNTTSATIGGANTKVTAGNIAVSSLNDSYVGGGAGAVAVSLSASGTGLAIIANTIDNATTATVDSAALTASNDILVGAVSKGELMTFAVSVGVGSTSGVGGSVATSIALNDAKATISGATLDANNNVVVAASNTDTIHAVAGAVGVGVSGVGVGLSTVVNIVRGETSAAIGRNAGGTIATIRARATGSDATIDSGIVNTAFDYAGVNVARALVALLPDISSKKIGVGGLSVVASSQQNVGSVAVAVSGAVAGPPLAASVSPVVNVLGGKTSATVTDASINETGTQTATADVAVIATSNTFTENVVVGAAFSGGGALAAGFVSNIMERETTANVSGATIGSGTRVRDVLVRATGTMDSLNVVAGAAVGAVGGAGSMIVNVFDADTTAKLAGGRVVANSLTVDADSTTGFLGAAGAGAYGSTAVAGAMNISVNLGSTRALVGEGTRDTALTLVQDLDVSATSIDKQMAFAVGASVSGGGGFGVAAMLNLSVLMSDTIASVNRVAAGSTLRNAKVAASNSIDLLPVTGGLAIAVNGAGVGAAVNLMLTKSSVSSEIVNSAFTASGTVDVTADALRKIKMNTFTAGVGGSAGIGAAIGIVVAGIGMSSDASGELHGTLGAANAQANQSTNSGYVENGTPGAYDASGDTRKDLVTDAVGSSKQDAVRARIAGSTLTAGATSVVATSKLEISNLSIGVGVGGVGVGAALGFTVVNQDVAATVDAATTLNVASLSVKALSGAIGSNPAVSAESGAGAGGLAGGLGAAVAVAKLESDVTARIAGAVNRAAGVGMVEVLAEDKLSVKTNAVGAAAAGGVAIGLSIAVSDRDTTVTASVDDNARITSTAGAGSDFGVSVTATAAGATTASAKAGAGGILGAGVGASATALDETNVLARIGKGATVSGIGSGGVTVAAAATPETHADSLGVAVSGGYAVGASVAYATADVTVRAEVDDNASIGSAGGLSVLADVKRNGSVDSVYSNAVAGSGALMAAVQATVSEARMTASNTAALGQNVTVASSGKAVAVKATTRTRQHADTTGVAVGGFLALGANVAEAASDSTTDAHVGDGAMITAASLAIKADGSDENRATSVAGGGGIISGSAAVANTDTVSKTTATLGAGSVTRNVALTGLLDVGATHLGTISGTVNSVNAGLVGASGAIMLNTVDSTVTASLAENARVTAGNFDLRAVNATRKLFEGETSNGLRTGVASTFNRDGAGWNLDSGSGGIVNLPAGYSQTTISHATTASLGRNAAVKLVVPAGSRSTANVEAYNEIIAHDKAKLDSGGAIALADTRSLLTVSRNDATASFGEGASIVAPNGNINVAAYDNADLDVRAASTTYGIAGAPSGAAKIDYTRANLVTVAKDAMLEANSNNDVAAGIVQVAAGASLDGTLSHIVARSTVDLYNNSAIPISTTPDAATKISGNSSFLLAGGSATGRGLRSAGDMTIIASKGLIDATAVGTGKDIYREALAALASGVSELFGGGKVSFDYKAGTTTVSSVGTAEINGTLLTGIARSKSLTIEYATENVGTCIVANSACLKLQGDGEIGYTLDTGLPIGAAIVARIKELGKLLSAYSADPVAKGAFSAELAFLQAKLTALGYSKDGTAGAFGQLSDYELAQRNITSYGFVITSLDTQFATQAGTVSSVATTIASTGTSLVSNGTALTTALGSINTAATDAITTLKTLGNYNDSANASANATDLASINTALTAIGTASSTIATAQAGISTSKGLITSAQTAIAAQLTLIGQKQAALTNLGSGGDAATIAGLKADITAAQGVISTKTAVVETELGKIDTYAATIAGQKSTINTNITAVTTAQDQITTRSKKSGDDSKLTSLATYATTIGTGKTTVATQYDGTGGVTANVAAVATAKTNLAVPAGASSGTLTLADFLDSVSDSRVAFDALLSTTLSTLGSQSKTAAGAPTTDQITVDDTVARLGDLSITADRLTGSGVLAAPGDASISIINRTANALVVGNLTIDGESGGQLRYNGVLVNSNADINRLNAVGSAASFATITTAANQGDIRPTIVIRNEYNSNSTAYYDPSINPAFQTKPSDYTPALYPSYVDYDATAAAANHLYYKTRPYYAPDLTLKSGTSVYNPAGSVVLTSQQGNIYSNAEIEAGSVSITAKNGDFVQSYTYGFDHIAGDPQSGTANGTGIVANGAVSISARYLNINGVIQSGMANRFVTIGTAPVLTASASALGVSETLLKGYDKAYKDAIATGAASAETIDLGNGLTYRVTKGEKLGQLEFSIAYARAHLTGKVALAETDATATAAQLREIIGVSYDTAADNFVIDGTTISGGYIQLYGQILNTNASGAAALKVLDGFGQISINNLNSRDIVLGAMSTGEDASGTGRGVRGIIDITDIQTVGLSGAYSVAVTKTQYSRDLVNGVLVAVQDSRTGALDASGTFVKGTFSNGTFSVAADQTSATRTVGSSRSAEYDPQTGLRYIYLKGVDSSLKTVTEYQGTQFFGSSDLRTAPSGSVVGTPTSYRLNAYDLISAATVAVSTDATLIAKASDTTSATYNSGGTKFVKTDEWRNCNWWTLCIASSYHYIIEATTPQTTITTTSTKADYGIKVEFIGRDTGSLSVTSSLSDILLAGALKNASGTTTITATAGDIVQKTASARITAKDISLTAAGSVGSLDAGGAVKIALNGGALSANAQNGNVVVDASTAVGVGQILASGDVTSTKGRVVLTAAGSITGTSGSLIQAPRVALTSTNGSIGSTTSLLKVNTGFTADPTLRPFGDPDKGAVLNTYYGLKATAAGDIGITSGSWAQNADGTMLLDRVTSLGGNVSLKTAGSILDNNPIQSIDTRTYAELLSYWNSLGLLAGAANDAKTAAVIKAYENSVSAEKLIYGQIRARQADGGVRYDAGFVYAMTTVEKAGFAASLRLVDPTLSTADVDARIATYEAEQTARYHSLNTELAALGGSFDGTGHYVASQAEIDARTSGAVWTERELAFSLSPGALKTITGTNPVIKAANVSGRTVTLDAGKAIGEVASTVIIPTNIAPSALTDAQKIALATAERSDFVSSAPGTIGITQTRGVNFDAADSLNVAAGTAGVAGNGFAYLNSLGDAKLGTVSVPEELRLKVRGSIINASTTSAAISAGSYILEASNGGIGVSRALDGSLVQGTLRLAPINTSALTSGTIIARAADAVNLRVEGNANIDTVYSRGDVTLRASKSIRNANSDSLINVLGDDVALTADDGAIGSAGNRLNVGNGLDGAVSATATREIALSVPAGQRGTLGSISAGTTLDVLSALDLLVGGQVSAVTGAVFSAGGQLAVGSLGSINVSAGALSIVADAVRMLTGASATAAGAITLASAGDAQVTGLTTASAAARAISITAGGSILAGTTAGRTDLAATTAGAGIFLKAGTGIGERTVANTTLADIVATAQQNALVIRTAHIDAATDHGSLALDAQTALTGGQLVAGDGAIDLVARDDSRLDVLSAVNGDVAVRGEGALALGPITAGGGVSLDSAGTLGLSDVLSRARQRLTAVGDISFGTLATTGLPGDVTLSSTGGSVRGHRIDAEGAVVASAAGDIRLDRLDAASAVLAAQGDIAATTIASDGALRLDAARSIRLTTATAGGAIDAAAGGSLLVSSMTSGGSQRLSAGGDLGFDVLKTLGMAGDTGRVDLTSRNGAVRGSSVDANGAFTAAAAGDIGLDRLDAASADLAAQGDIAATSIATDGALRLAAAKSIRVTTTTAGGSVDATAGGGLRVSSMLSGGSQRLTAGSDLVFDMLKTLGIAGDVGDVDLTSRNGAVLGGTVDANGRLMIDAHTSLSFDRLVAGGDLGIKAGGPVRGDDLQAGGEMSFDFGGSDPVHLKTVRSKALNFSSQGALAIDQAYAGASASFAVPNLTIGTLTHTGSGAPLAMSIGGYGGGVAESIAMNIVSADGVSISRLHAVDGRFTTTGDFVAIADGYVPGSLRLQTPDRVVWMNNRRQTPVLSADTQLYAPKFAFGLVQEGKSTYTDSYVVRSGLGSHIHFLSGGQDYLGASFIKDFTRWMQNPARQQSATPEEPSLGRRAISAIMNLFRSSERGSVAKSVDGPAVNLTAADGFEQP